eukprot:SAG31_NODE_218_length_19934_cov_81.634837_15_plen_789_part_00
MIEESHIAYYDGKTSVASAVDEEPNSQLEFVDNFVEEPSVQQMDGEPEVVAPVIPDEYGDAVYFHAEEMTTDRTAALRAQHERIGTGRELAAVRQANGGTDLKRKMAFRRTSEFAPRRVGEDSWEIDAVGGMCAVRSVAPGYCFTLAVVERKMTDGTVRTETWAWGINEKGQLGLGHRWIVDTPERITAFTNESKVVKLAAGHQHSAAVLSDGRCCAWGLGVFGQLGHGDTSDSLLPRPIISSLCADIVDIACGSYHTLFQTRNGTLLACGHAEYGQLGTIEVDDEDDSCSHIPNVQPVEGLPKGEKIAGIACGWLHSMATTCSGRLLTFGWGSAGVLGHSGAGIDKGFAWYRLGQAAAVSAFGASPVMVAAGGWKHCAAVVNGSGAATVDNTAGATTSLGPLMVGQTDAEAAAAASRHLDLQLLFSSTVPGDLDDVYGVHRFVVFARSPTFHRFACRQMFDAGALANLTREVNDNGVGRWNRQAISVLGLSPFGDRARVALANNPSSKTMWVDVRNLEPADQVWKVQLPPLLVPWRKSAIVAALRWLYVGDLFGATASDEWQLRRLAEILCLPQLVTTIEATLVKRGRGNQRTLSIQNYGRRTQFIEAMHSVLASPERYGGDILIELVRSDDSKRVQFLAHKSVLTSRSAYFRTMFDTCVGRLDAHNDNTDSGAHGKHTWHGWERCELQLEDFHLPVGDFRVESFASVLAFCYLGAMEEGLLHGGNAVELMCIADALMIPELKLECEQLIEFQYLDRDNAHQLQALCDWSPDFAPRLALACKTLLGV